MTFLWAVGLCCSLAACVESSTIHAERMLLKVPPYRYDDSWRDCPELAGVSPPATVAAEITGAMTSAGDQANDQRGPLVGPDAHSLTMRLYTNRSLLVATCLDPGLHRAHPACCRARTQPVLIAFSCSRNDGQSSWAWKQSGLGGLTVVYPKATDKADRHENLRWYDWGGEPSCPFTAVQRGQVRNRVQHWLLGPDGDRALFTGLCEWQAQLIREMLPVRHRARLLSPPQGIFRWFEGAVTGKAGLVTWLKGHGFKDIAPTEYAEPEDIPAFPVLAKPVLGEYSRGIVKVESLAEAKRVVTGDGDAAWGGSRKEQYVFQALIAGPPVDHSIHFAVVNGSVLPGPMRCQRIPCTNKTPTHARDGIMRGAHGGCEVDCEAEPFRRATVEAIAREMKYHGFLSMSYRVQSSSGNPVVFDINTRIGGSLAGSKYLPQKVLEMARIIGGPDRTPPPSWSRWLWDRTVQD